MTSFLWHELGKILDVSHYLPSPPPPLFRSFRWPETRQPGNEVGVRMWWRKVLTLKEAWPCIGWRCDGNWLTPHRPELVATPGGLEKGFANAVVYFRPREMDSVRPGNYMAQWRRNRKYFFKFACLFGWDIMRRSKWVITVVEVFL